MNTSHHNRALDDIDVREEQTDAGVVAGGRIEFATFTEGEYVESILIDRTRATVICRDLGRILRRPSHVFEALRTFIKTSIMNSLGSSTVKSESIPGEARGVPSGTRSDDGPIAEIHSLLVASIAHVTAREAQSLTDRGYSQGEYGWFFYVGQNGSRAFPELDFLSDGLGAVIRQAQERRCRYVLLDRDAIPLSGIATYDW
jgi:hypothetical protein